jgi:hypothetical protein
LSRYCSPAVEAHFQFLMWLVPAVEKFEKTGRHVGGVCRGHRSSRPALRPEGGPQPRYQPTPLGAKHGTAQGARGQRRARDDPIRSSAAMPRPWCRAPLRAPDSELHLTRPDFPYFGGWRRIAPRRICQGIQCRRCRNFPYATIYGKSDLVNMPRAAATDMTGAPVP